MMIDMMSDLFERLSDGRCPRVVGLNCVAGWLAHRGHGPWPW